jgi:hypothetical protein
MVTYRTVLELKYAPIEWQLTDDNDYDTLTWPTDYGKPSQEYLDAQVISETNIQAGDHNRQAIQNRIRQYPSITDQLDFLWHAMDVDESKRLEPFYTNIKTVKDANPKSS